MSKSEWKQIPVYTKAQCKNILKKVRASSSFKPPFKMLAFGEAERVYNIGLPAFEEFDDVVKAEIHESLISVAHAFRQIKAEGRYAVGVICVHNNLEQMIIDTQVLDTLLDGRMGG